jgi:adenine phosphoribosyltransferase
MNNKTLIENLRCIPDFPKKGINFRDVTTLYKNAECVQIMLDELEAYYKDKGITKIVGIESRGFIMASALAGRMKCGIVMARKPGKLPATVIKEHPTRMSPINAQKVSIIFVLQDWQSRERPKKPLGLSLSMVRWV